MKKPILVLLGVAFTLFSADMVFARGNPRFESNAGNGPFICNNGRTYELYDNTVFVDGVPARNYVSYKIDSFPDGSGISVWENGFKQGLCRMATPPSPPQPSKRWNHYVKICNPECHWETQEIL